MTPVQKAKLEKIDDYGLLALQLDCEHLEFCIRRLEGVLIEIHFKGCESEAQKVKDQALKLLREGLELREIYEEHQEEIDREIYPHRFITKNSDPIKEAKQ
ncbi:hypothetical protein MO867_17885 [Microbulbifer sp. OS29]|uniref:Uncharacterized protein n=1 Tax=Microbulbifer okhotskensis TaxID=2926617 RepID=A0A9X2EQZ0_9GAMM|nr:hypothetical protein [Microbulbifer okhotskensis]MCO1336204.1 hypothetical protein [Microbulbifer okhotskensis]